MKPAAWMIESALKRMAAGCLGILVLWGGVGYSQIPVIRNTPGGIPEPPPGLPARESQDRPVEPEVPQGDAEAQTGVRLTRIVLSSDRSALDAAVAAEEEGIEIVGVPLVEELGAGELVSRLEPFLGAVLSEATTNRIGKTVHRYYVSENRPVLLVHLLVEEKEKGRVGFLVREGKMGAVRVEGARWFDPEWLGEQVRLEPGGAIDRGVLVKDLDWLNQNPFRYVDVLLAPGEAPESSDVVLKVTDRFPLRAFVGVENTGSESLGEWRGNVGVQWGNAFGWDHQLAYQYSAAFEDVEAQQVHALTWVMPLSWRHRLEWYFSYGDSFYNLGEAVVNFGGNSWQVSPRYTIPLNTEHVGWTQQIGFGFDVKRSDYAVSVLGEEVPTNHADVVQGMVEYAVARAWERGRTSGMVGLVYSPGGLTSRNEDEDFRVVDPRTEADYAYFTGSLRHTQWLKGGEMVVASVTGQYSPDVLLSTENLGIGGYSTVRGYEERILFGDTGAYGGMEFRTRNLGIMGGAGGSGASVQGLAFVDAGWVQQSEEVDGLETDAYMVSAGVGLRCEWSPYASLRADIGFPVDTNEEGLSSSARGHFSFVIGF